MHLGIKMKLISTLSPNTFEGRGLFSVTMNNEYFMLYTGTCNRSKQYTTDCLRNYLPKILTERGIEARVIRFYL